MNAGDGVELYRHKIAYICMMFMSTGHRISTSMPHSFLPVLDSLTECHVLVLSVAEYVP